MYPKHKEGLFPALYWLKRANLAVWKAMEDALGLRQGNPFRGKEVCQPDEASRFRPQAHLMQLPDEALRAFAKTTKLQKKPA